MAESGPEPTSFSPTSRLQPILKQYGFHFLHFFQISLQSPPPLHLSWPPSLTSCFQVHLSCPTVQSGWSFYNTNRTMSLFFLQRYCPHGWNSDSFTQQANHVMSLLTEPWSQATLFFNQAVIPVKGLEWSCPHLWAPWCQCRDHPHCTDPIHPYGAFFPLWFLDTTSCFPLPYGLLLLTNLGSCSWISSFVYLHISPPCDPIQHHGFKSQLVAQW